MSQLTRHEAELATRQEERNRRNAHRHLIQMDQKDKNGSMTFKALRDQEQKVIAGLPCPVSAPARLLRLSKGKIRLLLLADQSFRLGDATYGDFRITIKSQDQRFVEIQTDEGPLPTKASLEQKQYTQEIQKLSAGFFACWAPMWLRDTQHEAQCDEVWQENFQEIMDNLPPQPRVPVSWDDPTLIKSTIAKMKPYKAPGVDGWRAQELKLVPWLAIIHLSQLFSRNLG